jgi:hypothetical protein
MNLIVSMHISELVCEPLQVCNENIVCMKTNKFFWLRNVEIEGRKGLRYGSVVRHKEDQLLANPYFYGKKNPILVKLVPVWNRYEK